MDLQSTFGPAGGVVKVVVFVVDIVVGDTEQSTKNR
jgi:hypothetical protein